MKEQAVQSPFANAWPGSFDDQGARSPGRTSIRWNGASSIEPGKIFLDTDQNSKTGYSGGGIAVGAEYMFESDEGTTSLLQYTGTGTDWNWEENCGACRARPSRPRRPSCVSFDTKGLNQHASFEFSDPRLERRRASNL